MKGPMINTNPIRLLALMLVLAFLLSFSESFLNARPSFCTTTKTSVSLLHAKSKKNKKGGKGSKGFGKEEKPAEASSSAPPPKPVAEAAPPALASPSAASPSTSASFLQSVEEGGSNAIPTIENDNRSELPPEERTKQILREKYGLKSLEEQQLDAKQREALKERQRKLADWKQKVAEEEDLDVMAMLPPPVIIAIDRFLKIGVAVTSLLFILAGLGITLEAYSKAARKPLPENIDSFLVNIVEPNFTPGLLVLLGFSVSLGAFAALQLSSSGAQYKEK